MLQAAVCDGCTLDAFTLGKDYLGPVEVEVSRREVVPALVIADVVIVLDEGFDLPFEIAGHSSSQMLRLRTRVIMFGSVPFHFAGFWHQKTNNWRATTRLGCGFW